AANTESINVSECGMKGLCRFVCATQSSSLHAVVTVRCGAVPLDEGRVRCHGRCAPQLFIASASAFFFFGLCEFFFFCFTMDLLEELWFWWLLHDALPCVSVAVFPRDAKAFDGVLTLLFAPCSQPCLAMAGAVGSATARLPCVSHLLPLFPRCVGGGGGERLRRWSRAPVGEGRHRPLLTATVFAAGDLTG
ncbi:hypothetical protein TcCL_Unassigned00649, partial [Trypanosoma cruzi]